MLRWCSRGMPSSTKPTLFRSERRLREPSERRGRQLPQPRRVNRLVSASQLTHGRVHKTILRYRHGQRSTCTTYILPPHRHHHQPAGQQQHHSRRRRVTLPTLSKLGSPTLSICYCPNQRHQWRHRRRFLRRCERSHILRTARRWWWWQTPHRAYQGDAQPHTTGRWSPVLVTECIW